jgi:hypothetical protein
VVRVSLKPFAIQMVTKSVITESIELRLRGHLKFPHLSPATGDSPYRGFGRILAD